MAYPRVCYCSRVFGGRYSRCRRSVQNDSFKNMRVLQLYGRDDSSITATADETLVSYLRGVGILRFEIPSLRAPSGNVSFSLSLCGILLTSLDLSVLRYACCSSRSIVRKIGAVHPCELDYIAY